MTDRPDAPATPDIRPADARSRTISAVWLIPLVAVMVAGAIAWQSLRDRGSLIAITFPDASGVTVGETTLRYREVVVGVVEDVGFSSDLDSVNVYIRVNNEIAPYLDESAAFWIVQPQVTTRGVEGLGTILSGTYVEGTWDSEIGETRTTFAGDERAPIVPPGVDGTAIVLRAGDSARLGAGAPILYKGIEVGQIATPRLSADGSEVRLDAFILAPYDRQLTTATRFWDASGVSVSFGGAGLELNVGSVAALVEGGIVFDTLISGGDPVAGGHVFDIFEDRSDALASTFEAPNSRAIRFGALFPSAAVGLSEGSPVRYRGVRVGVVAATTGFINPEDPGGDVQLLAVMALEPARMGLTQMTSDLDGIDFVGALVQAGLRAQLVSTSLLGGELAIDLVDTDAIGLGDLDIGIADNPLIPTIEGDTSSITATAEGVLTRINDLPIEELLASATDLLDNVNRIAADRDTRAIPGATLAAIESGGGLIRDARAIVSSPQAAGVLADVQAITTDLRAVSARIAERELIDGVADTLESARATLANVEAGTENLAALTDGVRVLIDDAGRFVASDALQAIPALARDAVEGGRTILTSPAIAAVLEDAAAAAGDVRRLAGRVTADPVLTRVESALAAVERAAISVADGTEDLAALRSSIDGAVRGAEALLASPDLAAIPAAAREAIDGARDVLAAPALDAILSDVATAAQGVRVLLEGVGTPETAARIAAILADLETTASAVAAGTADLAALRAAIDDAVSGAAALLASPDLARIPASARVAIDEIRTLVALPALEDAVEDVAATTRAARALVEGVATPETTTRIGTILTDVETAAAGVAAGTADLAALRTSIDAAVAGAEALLASPDLPAIPAAAREAVEGARDLLAAPQLDAVLADAAAAAADFRTLTGAIGTEETAARVAAILADVETAARGVAAGTADLAALRASIDGAVSGAEALLASPDLPAIPAAARQAVEDVRDLLAAPQLGAILDDTAATAAGARALATAVGTEETAARIAAILDNLDAAASGVAAGTTDLATLRASIDAAVAGAESLLTAEGLQRIPDQASGVLADAGGLVGDARRIVNAPEIQALLTDLPAITADIRAITAELAEAQAAQTLLAALREAERAAASVAEGAEVLPGVGASAERVLAEAETLAANLNALTTTANGLQLDALVDSTTDLVRTADAFLSSDEAGDVPVVLSRTLEELRLTVEAIRTGGTLDNLNATLTSTADAAGTISAAATDLPALVARLQELASAATGVLSTYESEGRVAQELFATLRAATRAAEDVSSLSRTIERNPNSLLLGR